MRVITDEELKQNSPTEKIELEPVAEDILLSFVRNGKAHHISKTYLQFANNPAETGIAQIPDNTFYTISDNHFIKIDNSQYRFLCYAGNIDKSNEENFIDVKEKTVCVLCLPQDKQYIEIKTSFPSSENLKLLRAENLKLIYADSFNVYNNEDNSISFNKPSVSDDYIELYNRHCLGFGKLHLFDEEKNQYNIPENTICILHQQLEEGVVAIMVFSKIYGSCYEFKHFNEEPDEFIKVAENVLENKIYFFHYKDKDGNDIVKEFFKNNSLVSEIIHFSGNINQEGLIPEKISLILHPETNKDSIQIFGNVIIPPTSQIYIGYDVKEVHVSNAGVLNNGSGNVHFIKSQLHMMELDQGSQLLPQINSTIQTSGADSQTDDTNQSSHITQLTGNDDVYNG